MEEARPSASLSQPTEQVGNTCKEVKGILSLNLAQRLKTVDPTIDTLEGGNNTGEGSIQFVKEEFNGGTKDCTSTYNEWSKPRPGNDMEESIQSKGHAGMLSTVAERPAPRETEEMKIRVNIQRLYPRNAWLEFRHDSS